MSLVGRSFREWTLHAELARGGMGVIYRATHAFMRGEFAIKTLIESADEEGRERFFREARTASALKHPNIVQTFPPFLEGGVFFLPMELLRGNSLQVLMRAEPGPWPVHVATAYVAQAAAGLAHAHAEGVLHRDVKPGNILVLEDGHTVKVLDFGLSRSKESTTLTDEGVKVGTPLYIAPEVFDGVRATAASDLYALGVVLFRLLTKELPFEIPEDARHGIRLVRHIRTAQAAGFPRVDAIRSDVPTVLADLVARLLAEDPAARPASAREVALALGTGLGDPPEWAKRSYDEQGNAVAPRPPPLPSSPARTGRGPSALALYGGLALASAALVAGTLWWLSR